MKLIQGEIYHVFNRGINSERIFYENDNYYLFLDKVRKYIAPNCHILAYCLLPNHFHFLLTPNDLTNLPRLPGGYPGQYDSSTAQVQMNMLSYGFQMLLSSYAKALNRRHQRTGSLFTQNTRSKRTSAELYSMDYSLWCFNYIHNNPVVAGLASSAETWMFSSYREYLGKSTQPICNLGLGFELLSLEMSELIAFDGLKIPHHIIDRFS